MEVMEAKEKLREMRSLHQSLVQKANSLRKSIETLMSELPRDEALSERKQRAVTQEDIDLFRTLCLGCWVSEDSVKSQRRYKPHQHMYHVRAYIAWNLHVLHGLRLKQVAELMRGSGRTHASLHTWIQDAMNNPKFQRPPQEGEYGN